MPSESRSLALQPRPTLDLQVITTALTTDSLRQQLVALDSHAQTLKSQKATLERQLDTVRDQIAANDRQIRFTMRDLDKQLFIDQRTERQPAFRNTILNNDNVVEGLWIQMAQNPALKNALQAIVDEKGTVSDNQQVSQSLMAELFGNTFQFLHSMAVRVLEFDPTNTQQPLGHSNPVLDPSLRVIQDIQEINDDEAEIESSVAPLPSPDIKSESSVAIPIVSKAPSMLVRGDNNDDCQPIVARSIEAGQTRVSTPSQGSPEGMNRLEKAFPGFLDYLRKGEAIVRAKQQSPALAKRPRESVESDVSPSPQTTTTSITTTSQKPAKKPRTDKEAAISHTFVLLMKHLEQMHQQGRSIASNIRCSRCQQSRRDARVLNCLHMYCHKCILQLRAEAGKGDARTGFRAFCVRPGCDEAVSGKTTVVDSELIDFLIWYDSQPASVKHGAAQVFVLSAALVKNPGDDDIKRKLDSVETQVNALRLTGGVDGPCDLLKIAKLARKPY